MRALELIEGASVGASDTAGQNGIFTVDAGSSFMQTGAATVTLDGASGSQGTLNIGTTKQRWRVQHRHGDVHGQRHGTVNVGTAAGVTETLIANGSTAINGGTLNVYGGSVLTVAGGLTIGGGSLRVLVDPPRGNGSERHECGHRQQRQHDPRRGYAGRDQRPQQQLRRLVLYRPEQTRHSH